MSRWHGRLTAAALALGFLAAACGMDAETGAEPAQKAEAPAVIDRPAAKLQQTLTDLLGAHVFLAGIAVEQAVLTKDPESPQFTAAAEALDQNSMDLAAAIGSVYGAEAGDQFLELWRAHIGFFVDYTVAGIGGDTVAQDEAKSQLDQYRMDFGAFIDSATGGNLPADDAAAALQMHVDSLIGTIDQVLSGEGNPFLSLYASAHEHMPATASALAGAIAAANPDMFEG